MTSATDLLPDDVWRALDPYAGRLPRGTRIRMRLAAAGAVALLVACIVVWQSGIVVPHVVRSDTSFGWSADMATHKVTQIVSIRNDGWRTITVTGVGRSGPGMVLTSVDRAMPVVLPPSTAIELSLSYDVTDCAAVPQGRWPVPVRVQRPWGVFSDWIHLPRGTSPATPAPGQPKPTEQEWQAVLATTACSPVPTDRPE
jgi:hypothetical protein